MTDQELFAIVNAMADDSNPFEWDRDRMLLLCRRCIAIGRAEAFEEAQAECDKRFIPGGGFSKWAQARAAEERAKS